MGGGEELDESVLILHAGQAADEEVREVFRRAGLLENRDLGVQRAGEQTRGREPVEVQIEITQLVPIRPARQRYEEVHSLTPQRRLGSGSLLARTRCRRPAAKDEGPPRGARAPRASLRWDHGDWNEDAVPRMSSAAEWPDLACAPATTAATAASDHLSGAGEWPDLTCAPAAAAPLLASDSGALPLR